MSLGRRRRPGQRRRMSDRADLDDAVGRVLAHVARHADGAVARDHDGGGPARIAREAVDLRDERIGVGQHGPAEPPDARVHGGAAERVPERVRMAWGVERLEAHRAAPPPCAHGTRERGTTRAPAFADRRDRRDVLGRSCRDHEDGRRCGQVNHDIRPRWVDVDPEACPIPIGPRPARPPRDALSRVGPDTP